MSFKKRSIGLASHSNNTSATPSSSSHPQPQSLPPPPPPGIRPSPIDGRPTTSTGSASLDSLFAGHAGLPLGQTLLIEESGATEYSSTLARLYAAEGVVQGHKVHIIGAAQGERWGRALPGLVAAGRDRGKAASEAEGERMKIAWRYERLGTFSEEGERKSRASQAAVERQAGAASVREDGEEQQRQEPFCHTFDLAKRLEHPALANVRYHSIAMASSAGSCRDALLSILQTISDSVSSSHAREIHRLVIPSLLSPFTYPPHACEPQHILPFIHTLRGISRKHASCVSVLITLPLDLYSRDTGTVTLLEHLLDGVIELQPFPHAVLEEDERATLGKSGAATKDEEKPLGMAHVHKIPVLHERGGGVIKGNTGTVGLGGEIFKWAQDLSFTVTRRKFKIQPFHLPPDEGDKEAQRGEAQGSSNTGNLTKEAIEF